MIDHFGFAEMLYIVTTVRWTLLLTLIAFCFGSVFGAALALMRLSSLGVLRKIASGVIEVVQSVPVLMVLFLSYFSNLGAATTHFGTTTSPIYFGANYVSQRDWWRLGFLVLLATTTIFTVVGLVWWRILGWV